MEMVLKVVLADIMSNVVMIRFVYHDHSLI